MDTSKLQDFARELVERLEATGHGIEYFAGGAILFVFCGFACGYFLWRRGSMQIHDLKAENRIAATALEELRSGVEEDGKMFGAAEEEGESSLST